MVHTHSRCTMIKLPKDIEDEFIRYGKEQSLYLEGSIIKVLNRDNDEFSTYLTMCKERDTESRKKRLDVTKQYQEQNAKLEAVAHEKEQLMASLQEALNNAEEAKENALKDLSIMQSKSQVELIGNIVQIALWVIVGVGIIVTGMYLYSMSTNSGETTLIGNTWSNLFGILLTNSFSIIGTIMGVKYAQDNSQQQDRT